MVPRRRSLPPPRWLMAVGCALVVAGCGTGQPADVATTPTVPTSTSTSTSTSTPATSTSTSTTTPATSTSTSTTTSTPTTTSTSTTTTTTTTTTTVVSITTATPPNGSAIYAADCAACHGDELQGVVGPALGSTGQTDGYSDAELLGIIMNGRDGMPSFAAQLSEADIRAVIAFIRSN
ncbi:MAG: cytochrome c [Acidimicrobiia bacterium]|nr:cytochrome c [Acidimicrobiia bacterium]